jgi:hypothetical protein
VLEEICSTEGLWTMWGEAERREKGDEVSEQTPLQVLVAAKLAGTKLADWDDWGYTFRTNEQAAETALKALDEAGYEVTPKWHPFTTNTYTHAHDLGRVRCVVCGGKFNEHQLERA